MKNVKSHYTLHKLNDDEHSPNFLSSEVFS